MIGETNTIVIDRERYDELIIAEERVKLLEKAIASIPDYVGDCEVIKKIFEI